jgi:hypothetical protein
MSVRKCGDDVPDTKHMHNMDDRVLAEFQALYDEGFDFDPFDMSANQSSAFNAAELLKKRLTGEYTDPHSGGTVKYMMYNIPSSAGWKLKNYMQKLEKEYEALNMKKRPRSDVDGVLDSINPAHRAQIIELRQWIEDTQIKMIEYRENIKRKISLRDFYESERKTQEVLLQGCETRISQWKDELASLGAPHTGCQFIVPTSARYW